MRPLLLGLRDTLLIVAGVVAFGMGWALIVGAWGVA